MKNRFISIVAVIVAGLSAMISADAEQLRVMTYNVRNGVGMDNVRDHARIADVIKVASPDVVAIQEVDSMTNRSGRCYVLGDLGNLSEMSPVYSPAINFNGGKYGIGILCKQESLDSRRLVLPGREESRALLIVEFPQYVVACTHLSLTPQDALASTDIIRREAASYAKPFILMGDLNSHPDSAPIKMFQRDFRIVSPLEMTWPADTPTECLDYVMIANAPDCKVTSSQVVPAPSASDHRPIIVELTLPD